jgi:hypothetical protein
MDIYSRGFGKSMKVVELRLLSGNEEICTRGGGDAGQEWSPVVAIWSLRFLFEFD